MRSRLNNVLIRFLEKMAKELEDQNQFNGNRYDIPLIIAPMYQSFSFNPEEYDEFSLDLECDYSISIEDLEGDYGICAATLYFQDKTFDYYIEFTADPRWSGYCTCKPDDKNYRDDKGCCGIDCDWVASRFSMYKRSSYASSCWQGTQHDYWDFEDKFYFDNAGLKSKREKDELKQKINKLKEDIKLAQKELMELENIKYEGSPKEEGTQKEESLH